MRQTYRISISARFWSEQLTILYTQQLIEGLGLGLG